MLEEPPLIVRTQDSIIPKRNPSVRRFQKGCKPNFVFPENIRGRESFVSAASTRDPNQLWPWSGQLRVPYLALHPMGFSVPPRLRLERWALTPPFHPYPACNFKIEISGLAVCFLWHCPSGCLTTSPPACIPQSAFLRRQLQVTRHRALWCSDFPPPRNISGKRFSALPKSPLIYGRNARMQVDCKFRINPPQPNPYRGCNTGYDRNCCR